jgi:tripeptide aminopeptidase
MSTRPAPLDGDAAIALVLELLATPGGSCREGAIAAQVRQVLVQTGVPAAAMVDDGAHQRSPFGGEVGNLVVQLPGRGSLADAPRLLLSTHLDTVPLCVGTTPVRRGDHVVPADPAKALGADNRSGVGALLTVVRELRRQGLDHPPLTLVFFVQEEIGLAGSRVLDTALLGGPACALNVDGGQPASICHGAIGGIKWQAEIAGRAAHAGVHPRDGVSAAAVFALALSRLVAGGWHGEVVQSDCRGTANVGVVQGGDATNVVMDRLLVRGECRSHDAAFVEVILARYQACFALAAEQVRNDAGQCARVDFREENRYPAFRLPRESAPAVRAAVAMAELGLVPAYHISNGGQDANWLTHHGIPAITLGAGAHAFHTVDEYLDLGEYLAGCQLLLHAVCRGA